jgi:hypothetical protein
MTNSHRSRPRHLAVMLAVVACIVPANAANDTWTKAVAFYRAQLTQHGIIGSSLLVMKDGEIAGRARRAAPASFQSTR